MIPAVNRYAIRNAFWPNDVEHGDPNLCEATWDNVGSIDVSNEGAAGGQHRKPQHTERSVRRPLVVRVPLLAHHSAGVFGGASSSRRTANWKA
jgi:hypothetical protein